MTTIEELNTKTNPTWCPGCGNYPMLMTLKNAIIELGLQPHKVLIVAGVGCHGHGPQWINTYGFQGIHGRALPVATAAKLANTELEVFVEMGDGDCLAIGTGHFVHACRRNVDMTAIIHDNHIYGLTTGQTSPTADKGFVTKSTPFGSTDPPVNPIALALASGATFIARGFAGNIKHLQKLIVAASRHKGFAIIDVMQPCVVWNKVNTYDFWQTRLYDLAEAGHNPADKDAAWAAALEWGDKIPMGIFYIENRPTLEEQLPQLATPLVKQQIPPDITKLLEEFQ